MDVRTLSYPLVKVDAKRLLYALTDRLLVVEENKVGKEECQGVLDTPADRKSEVEVHSFGDTLSELKGMETLHTLSVTVAENKVELLGDTQLEVNTKALGYRITDTEEEVKVKKLGDTSQRRK